jgi:hypothetical protein
MTYYNLCQFHLKLGSVARLDFIIGLPKSEGYEVIMVIVERFTKFNYFIPLKHSYTAITMASAFFNNIYLSHDLPTSIVSDRDSIFTGKI